jgi:NAD(P)-dependent dehydrogenase (short-subunit alcohol dehydrogenase family)
LSNRRIATVNTGSSASGRSAIVTGAGTGIGRAVAIGLLTEGYQVALAGRGAEPLEEAARASGWQERALVVPTDVTSSSSVASLFERVRQ